MRFALLLLLNGIFIGNIANAQQVLTKEVELNWLDKADQLQVPGKDESKKVLQLKGASYPRSNGYNPLYFMSFPLENGGDVNVELTNQTFASVKKQQLVNEDSITKAVAIDYYTAFFKRQPQLKIELTPIRKNPENGQLEKLLSADIRITIYLSSRKKKRSTRQFAESSVLKSGDWYKVAVEESKVYKMSYSFLQDLGMDVDNISPSNIRVYGNGGGMLPEANSVERANALQQNAIQVVSGNDGSFDSGDYVLFYGESPHEWRFNDDDNRFTHRQHIYSDQTYYFITADLGEGERISAESSTGTANVTVTTFDDFAYHENDERNLIESGRIWFGETFDNISSTLSLNFNFPDLISSEDVFVRSAVAARSVNPNPRSTFRLAESGNNILNQEIPSVGPSYTAAEARRRVAESVFSPNGDELNFQYTFQNSSPSAEGWLDYLEVNVRRALTLSTDQMDFRDQRSVGPGNKVQFILQGASSNTKVWDVTDPTEVHRQAGNVSNGTFSFTTSAETLRHYMAFNDNIDFPEPEAVGSVANQNLHGTIGQPDMVIVTHEEFKSASETLANYHRTKSQLNVATVERQKVFNEFSSGAQDATAIRDMMKMLYDKAGSDTSQMPQYLLLMGDGSYDFKDRVSDNTNYIPTYQSKESLSPTGSYVSDDYFGFLDNGEGGDITSQNAVLDLAIGRLPVATSQDAQNVVNKITNYHSTDAYGDWRNKLTFVADDEDQNLHLNDANGLTNLMANQNPVYNIDKIYFDTYQQVSTAGGSRYPGVNEAINQKMFSGTLIMNYTGHGGVDGWAEERVLDDEDVNSWNNKNKLPLFITATCEFSRYDNPAYVSTGEKTLLKKDGGTIGLVTTVRLVFASANETINRNFLKKAFQEYKGRMPTLGEAVMRSKNAIGSNRNNRKFTLLGDPALQLAYPQNNVVTTNVTNQTVPSASDTLKALSKVTIDGEVRNNNNNLMNDFEGTVFPTVFDKPQIIETLANDPGSNKRSFQLQNNALFQGKASVSNGKFEFTFVVPKDISYNFGNGKVSYYANNEGIDANGYSDDIVVGGAADSVAEDNTGPEVNIFMNNENFAFGGVTDENPLMLVKLQDENGINTVGSGIGHDMTAVLDGDTKNTIVLNEFYEAALDNYKKGKVEYPLSGLEDGRHTLKVKAWDVHNNSGEGYTEFVVASSEEMALDHVLNYPNPFTTSTSFQFEHNKPGQNLFVQVKIFTVTGKLVKTIEKNIITDGYRVDNINWNGLDHFGDKIGRGVYIYQLNVQAEDGTSGKEFQKLVILR